VNSAEIPVSLTKSYSAYAGVQDAMIQWWYGHNAVGFFLTAGFLGMMYYFVPKQAGRPVYSYRLSVVHFWALIFTYMWAGPHHLHYTALPDWTQSVGMVFSLILLAPSWGGMINGIMTLSGAWHKLRTDPILKFLITSLSFYGMSTFEGPMMSIKTVNALSHYTDWTVGHVHSGALGWVAMISIGSVYYLIPRLYGKTEMYSVQADQRPLLDRDHRHRAVHRLDVDLRCDAGPDVACDQPGRHADLLLRRVGQGQLPVLDDPLHRRRAVPGGMLIMFYNMMKTIAGQKAYDAPVLRPPAPTPDRRNNNMAQSKHEKIERNVSWLIVLTLLTVSVGGLVEIVPLFFQHSTPRPTGEWPQALRSGPSGGARHLRPRRLLQLPLADDPSVPRRDRALRPLLGGRRVRVRPPVPVGLQAHRSGPRPRRWPLLRRMASCPPDQPARRGARVQHAGLPVARSPGQVGGHRRQACARCNKVGVPSTPTRRSPPLAELDALALEGKTEARRRAWPTCRGGGSHSQVPQGQGLGDTEKNLDRDFALQVKEALAPWISIDFRSLRTPCLDICSASWALCLSAWAYSKQRRPVSTRQRVCP
jgi:hypothetical protein